jgi:cathepsin L
MTTQPKPRWMILIAYFALAIALTGSKCNPIMPSPPPNLAQEFVDREHIAPQAARQELADMRRRLKEQNLDFQVGYTYAMERGVPEITGGQLDPNTVEVAKKWNPIANKVLQIDRAARDLAIQKDPGLRARLPEFTIACQASSKSFDWRSSGKVTAVRAQGCGNCWAYGAMAPLESSYLIRNNETIDGSEQFIVSNSGAGSCKGGGTKAATDFLVSTGTTTDVQLPDSGTDGTPNVNLPKPYQALVSGFVSDTAWIPSVSEIKAALCEHGPVSSWVGVTDTFAAYAGGGVYKDPDYATKKKKACPPAGQPIDGAVCGHFVTIIGWNDAKNAWLVKNSWGPSWGDTGGAGTEKGYMWIDYGTNEIGGGAIWEMARNKFYRLPRIYYEVLRLRIPPDVGPPVDIRLDVGKP